MNSIGHRLAKIALEIGAIKLQPSNPFTWTSGYRMPIYNDNRLLLGDFEHRALVADGFINLLEDRQISYDLIAGTETAGIPFGVTLADRLKAPFVYVKKKPKAHGLGKQVEGVGVSGKRVLLVEDLISMGTSSSAALEALRVAGATIDTCVSVFTYELEESKRAFHELGAKTFSLLTFSELLSLAKEVSYISQMEFDVLSSWSTDPTGWGEKNGLPKV